MKIGFVSLDWSDIRDLKGHPTPGGAGWYRCALPASELAKNGISTAYGAQLDVKKTTGEFIIKDWDGEARDGLDVVVLQRWMDDHAAHYIRGARAAGQIVINDCDDWYDGLDTSNMAFKHTHPKFNADTNRNHYRKALGASSALTVSTTYLAGRLERLGVPCLVVPNAIDVARWDEQDVSGDPLVGWVGATGFRSKDLETLRGVLGPFCARHGVPFHHSGAAVNLPPAAEALALSDNISTTYSSMAGILEYPKLFEHFNIGIVPLSDRPFNSAKSAIKGLEYGAAGIPFVASSTPSYEHLHCTYGAGLVARRPKDWIRHLEHLLDADERAEIGAAGRAAAIEHDIANRWVDWRDAYQSLISST